MEDKIYGIIYEIKCIDTESYYIGQHVYDKPELDPYYFCSSCNPKFWHDLDKYGEDRFEHILINICYSQKN